MQMPTNTLETAVTIASNPILAGLTSFASTVGLAAEALPVPAGVPAWLPYIVSIAGPVLTVISVRILNARAAHKRALAEAKAQRAKQMREDGDPLNDREAADLEDTAAALRAEAAALEAARS